MFDCRVLPQIGVGGVVVGGALDSASEMGPDLSSRLRTELVGVSGRSI